MKIRLVFVLVVGIVLLVNSTKIYSQERPVKITLKKETTIKNIIKEIEKLTQFTFIYNNDINDLDKIISIDVKNESLDRLLSKVFYPLKINFLIRKKKIILRKFDFKGKGYFTPMLKITSSSVNSQKLIINQIGRVRSTLTGEGLQGVNIKIKNKKKGTYTDINGYFNIQTTIGDTALVTYIGYKPKTFVTGLSEKIDILIEPNMIDIEEVCIVGYGTQVKRKATGSVFTIKNNPTHNVSYKSVDHILKGGVPGLMISSNVGVPESSSTVLLRGINTLNVNANFPLIVLDGVPIYGNELNFNLNEFTYSSQSFSSYNKVQIRDDIAFQSEFERNPLMFLNVEDIESISVLKDAYATAIYGSRGASGVIMINTKSGKKDNGLKIFYNTSVGAIGTSHKVLNSDQYVQIYSDYLNKKIDKKYNTNWKDKLLRMAWGHNLGFNFSKQKDKSSLFISSSLLTKQSVIINNDYYRITGRFNFSYDFTEKLKFSLNSNIIYSDNSAINSQKLYRNSLLKSPNTPIYDSNGGYFYELNDIGKINTNFNPLAQAKKTNSFIKTTRIISNLSFEYKILRDLKYKAEVGVDRISSTSFDRDISQKAEDGGIATELNKTARKIIYSNLLSFIKNINHHYFDFILGQSFELSNEKLISVYGEGFINDHITDISQADKYTINSDDKSQWALFSVYSRLNYAFDNKYLLGISLRMDGSSRFPENNRYEYFPAYSLGWRIAQEDFFNIAWVNELKLRASYGITGIDGSFGYYGYQGYYAENKQLNYAGITQLENVKPNNPNLKWETISTSNIGLDLVLFDNKLELSADVYKKDIKNMLYVSALPAYIGYASELQNIGNMTNKGVEFYLNIKDIFNSKIKVDFSFNYAYNQNTLNKLNYTGMHVGTSDEGYKYYGNGSNAGNFYLYDWVKVNPENGNPVWRLKDGSLTENPPHILAEDQRKIAGRSIPDFFGGFTFDFKYKKFELNTIFSYSYGNKLINGSRALLADYTNPNQNNLGIEVMNYWKQKGQLTTVPALNNKSITEKYNYVASRTSDQYLEDASYLKLKSLAFRYHVSKKFLNKFKIAKANIYFEVFNVFTLTKYSGLDPEVSALGSSALLSGYDELTLPQQKTFSMGLNVFF